jgi:thiamine biosynthesis lipoprotein
VRRAKPLLGTIVSIRIAGLAGDVANRAIELAFAEVARIHALMSFHEPQSDLGRLNRDAAAGPVAVDPRTFEVIGRAVEIAAASGGAFDPTVAAELVAWGYLPRPDSDRPPAPDATWLDIELIQPESTRPGRIRFRRPLWLDLGGIAKGYAVDRALAAMRLGPEVQCCVNAGGDLAIRGPRSERILLRTDRDSGPEVPAIELEGGSLASSSGRANSRRVGAAWVGPHLDGAKRRPAGTRSFVSVVAESCLVADALTKVVLARGRRAAPVLRRYGAIAHLQGPRGDWSIIGGAA